MNTLVLCSGIWIIIRLLLCSVYVCFSYIMSAYIRLDVEDIVECYILACIVSVY